MNFQDLDGLLNHKLTLGAMLINVVGQNIKVIYGSVCQVNTTLDFKESF